MRTRRSNIRKGTISKYIECDNRLVVLQVPVVYAPEDPDEPLLQAKTIKFLGEARRRAKASDFGWLRKHGARIYVDAPAA